MENRPSRHPQDIAVRAALHDAAALAAMAADEFTSTYAGGRQHEYLTVLESYVSDFAGRIEADGKAVYAVFGERRISVRFP